MTLPVLLSIPHGGMGIPEELRGAVSLGQRDLFYDSDAFTADIYDIGGAASRVVKADVARAFVDVNRSMQDLPPGRPDGMVKERTCHGAPIYKTDRGPEGALLRALIDRHYMPYHRAIQKITREEEFQLCLDCHSMAPFAPETAPDAKGALRPAFCLSNADGQASSREMVDRLASCISDSFGIGRSQITCNDPFHGGHITRTYGNNPYPWIQVEMNRDMYLSPRWFDPNALTVDPDRIRDLNGMFRDALCALFAQQGAA